MPDGVQNILLPALDENVLQIPKIGSIRASKGFQVVATQNPKEFVGVLLVSEALRDRFELLSLDYQTFEEEEAIVAQLTGLSDTLLIREAVFLTRSTRNHPLVRRGASVRAAAAMTMIAHELGGNETLARAAELALPTRIEFKEDMEENPKSFVIQLVEDTLKKKAPKLNRSSC